jgi:hypothetical protein
VDQLAHFCNSYPLEVEVRWIMVGSNARQKT